MTATVARFDRALRDIDHALRRSPGRACLIDDQSYQWLDGVRTLVDADQLRPRVQGFPRGALDRLAVTVLAVGKVDRGADRLAGGVDATRDLAPRWVSDDNLWDMVAWP